MEFRPFCINARRGTASLFAMCDNYEQTAQGMISQGFDPKDVHECLDRLVLDKANIGATIIGHGVDIIDPMQPTVVPQAKTYTREQGMPKLVFHYKDPCDIAYYDDFLNEEEIQHLLSITKEKFERSVVVSGEDGQDVIDARSSQSAYLALGGDNIIRHLEMKIANYFSWPVLKGEPLQVIKYQEGQEYKAHFDHFSSTTEANKHLVTPQFQRTATLIMYLKECEEGGATVFPTLGMRFAAKRGSALFFRYGLDELKNLMLHGGEPVIKGEKVIATKWFKTLHYAG